MSYIGQGLPADTFQGFTTDSFTGDGSATTFTLSKEPFSEDTLIVVINNVIQKPTTNFTVSGTTLTIVGTAVADGDVIYAIHTGGPLPIGEVNKLDLNGASDQLILDLDGDTTISADTDDQIDVKIGGTDALRVTGTALTGNAVATIGATGTASTLAGIPFFSDTTNGSIYTHDVSGTDSTAARNTAYGLTTLDAITTGDDNTVMGHAAGTALQDGAENVAIGTNSMAAATSAGQNTCVGHNSGAALSSGSLYNVLLGHGAGASMTTGNRNIAIGVSSMDGFDTEAHNLGIGISALGGSVAGGEYNIAIGNYAADALTSSDHNVIIGYQAGTDITGGGSIEGQNTLLGNYAGGQITDGYQNICLGYQSANGAGDGVGADLTTGYRNIIIGPYANMNNATHSHAIVMGYAIDGVGDRFTFGKPSNIVYNPFTVDNSWTQSSDVRKKKNIKDAVLGLDFINDLRTVTFEWKPNHEFPEDFAEYNAEENYMTLGVTMHGMIAQEVKEALDKTGVDRFGGWQEDENGSQYLSKEMFIYPLIKAVQELSAKVKALEEA